MWNCQKIHREKISKEFFRGKGQKRILRADFTENAKIGFKLRREESDHKINYQKRSRIFEIEKIEGKNHRLFSTDNHRKRSFWRSQTL